MADEDPGKRNTEQEMLVYGAVCALAAGLALLMVFALVYFRK